MVLSDRGKAIRNLDRRSWPMWAWSIFLLGSCIHLASCVGTNFSWSTVQNLQPGATFDQVCRDLGGKPQQVAYKEDGSFVAGWGYGDFIGRAKAVNLRFDREGRYVGIAGTWSPYGAGVAGTQM